MISREQAPAAGRLRIPGRAGRASAARDGVRRAAPTAGATVPASSAN